MRDVNPIGSSAPPDNGLASLRELIAAHDGFLPFETFMREALYHPRFGYYTRKISTVGRTGDFATSATLHPALGKAVAAWALARCKELPGRSPRHLIELGAGGGQLAASVLGSMGWWQRRRVHYHIVEISQPLRSEQQARLAGWAEIAWHNDIESALKEASGRAVIFSNEFVDAFPCVVLSWAGEGHWHEIGVCWNDESGELSETFRPWKHPPDAENLLGPAIFHADDLRELPTGQRVEWHREYERWLRGWHGLWTAGAMLTVDYGDVLPALYHRRPAGSLRAYFRHIRGTGPEIYQRPGHQDLTADVNFSDLVRWGTALGWENAIGSQADFLGRWLPQKDARKFRGDPAFDFLLDPDGAGGAFQVLEQRRC